MRLPAYSLLVLLLLGSTGCSGQEGGTSPAAEQAPTTDSDEQAQETAPQLRTPSDDRSVEQRVEDASLGARVQLALADAGGLSGYAFDTEVDGGRVILRGDVGSRSAYERAAEVARDVDGVGEVVNEVTVSGREIAAAEPEPEPEPDTTDEAPQIAENQSQEEASSTQEEEEAAKEEDEQEPEEDEAVYHTVRSGQSLWTIARQYDVSISQIQRLNDLSGSNIQPGQELRVK